MKNDLSKVSRNYLWITFFIMIVCWGTCMLFSINGYALNDYYVLYILWIVGGVSPTIASYFTLKKNGVVSGLKDWLKKLFDAKQKLQFYASLLTVLTTHYAAFSCLKEL